MVSLQEVDTWFSFNVDVSCTVAGPGQLVNISRGQSGSKTNLNVEGKDFHTPNHDNAQQQMEQRLKQATQQVVDRVMNHFNIQVKCLETLMSKQSLDGGVQPRSDNYNL